MSLKEDYYWPLSGLNWYYVIKLILVLLWLIEPMLLISTPNINSTNSTPHRHPSLQLFSLPKESQLRRGNQLHTCCNFNWSLSNMDLFN